MPKAREFWIAGKSDGSLSGYYSALKVREVVPIDWEKVWNKLDFFNDFENKNDAEKAIQKEVEKQLAGENETI